MIHGALNNIIGRQHCIRVTRQATPSVTCLDISLYLEGPLNTQVTYKIHDWTTFARVIKNVRCIPSTGNTTANSQLSKT
jgi:hypothetical protein